MTNQLRKGKVKARILITGSATQLQGLRKNGMYMKSYMKSYGIQRFGKIASINSTCLGQGFLVSNCDPRTNALKPFAVHCVLCFGVCVCVYYLIVLTQVCQSHVFTDSLRGALFKHLTCSLECVPTLWKNNNAMGKCFSVHNLRPISLWHLKNRWSW